MKSNKDRLKTNVVAIALVLLFGSALATAWDEFSTADIWTQLFILACSGVGISGIYWMIRAALSKN